MRPGLAVIVSEIAAATEPEWVFVAGLFVAAVGVVAEKGGQVLVVQMS